MRNLSAGTGPISAALACVVAAASIAACSSSNAAAVPKDITVGTLYASVGSYASSSLPQYRGLRFWVQQVNKGGGAYIEAYRRKLPIRLIAYDDQSSTSEAETLAAKLIQQDHVNILVSDFGSVLTSVIVPLAQENNVLLFDPTATAPSFFTESIFGNGNPDLVLTSLPSSALWPHVIATYLLKHKLSKVGIVYDANDFSAAQATTVEDALGDAGVIPDVFETVPTTTADYSSVIASMREAGVQAALEFGYASNDLAFLSDVSASKAQFPFVFTAFPGLMLPTFVSSIGAAALQDTYTYLGPPLLRGKVTYGLGTAQFLKAYAPTDPGAVNDLDVAGYVAGLIVQATLAHADSLTTAGLRAAAGSLSGKISTLAGPFSLDQYGDQTGELMPLAQLRQSASGGITPVIVENARGS